MGALAGVDVKHLKIFMLVQKRGKIPAALQHGEGTGHADGFGRHVLYWRAGYHVVLAERLLVQFLPVELLLLIAAIQFLHHPVIAAEGELFLIHPGQFTVCGDDKTAASIIDLVIYI